MKPRIAMLNSASVSVLAEGDVFLPCEAAGHPKPNISWTKVSTGKITTMITSKTFLLLKNQSDFKELL